MGWIIYLIGVVVTFLMLRRIGNKEKPNGFTVEDVLPTSFLSLFSWFAIATGITMWAIARVVKWYEKNKDKKI